MVNAARIVTGMVVMMAVICSHVPPASAQEGTEFLGTVLTVDQATGKFAVKKDGGGTRFTFVANEKTKFSGTGLASIKDLRKDDHVLVIYKVQGPQYLAISLTKK
jgi:hypothetical protein